MSGTMAVSTVTPLPKSQPDISKLNTFTGYIVTVTKHLGPRGTVGTGIISSKAMTKDQLLALPELLPGMPGAGAGYYAFTVTDAGGTGDDTWLVKLGPDITPQQEIPMAGPNGVAPGGFSGAPQQPLGEGVIHLGHNFYYNEAMGTLTTPWRTIVSWKQGDPMPQPPTSATATPAFTPPGANASPWGAPWPSSQWGGYPVSEDSSRTKQLEAEVLRLSREREMSDIRGEQRRVQEETNRRIEQQGTMFQQMFERLTAAISEIGKAPKGPSEEVIVLRQQNEQMTRRLDDEKREREAERRDAATREEMRRMQENTDRLFREMNTNKSDPMIPMLMQMFQQMNGGAMEAIKAIQSSTASQNTSAERQTSALVEQLRATIMNPMQIMQLMQASKGEGAEMAKHMIDSMRETNRMQHDVYAQLLEVAGQGGQPAWVQAIDTIAQRVGPIGEALAQRASQPKVVRVAVPVDPATGQPIRVTPAPAPAPTAISGAPGVAPAPGSTAPTEIRNTPPAEAAAPGKPKKGKKGGKKKTDDTPKVPTGKGPGGALTIEQIRDLDEDVLADAMDKFSDNVFFGDQLGIYVGQIRQRVVSGATNAEQLAKFLLDQRNALAAIEPMPPAVELFLADQIAVLIDRVVPDASDDFREKVVELMEDAIAAEAAGDDDEAEGE